MASDGAPNAKNEEGQYRHVGDHLKVRIDATRDEGRWLNFSPANVRIELNGQPLTTCQELTIHIKDGFPVATLKLHLEGIDIDADTMTRLQAFVDAKEEESHGD